MNTSTSNTPSFEMLKLAWPKFTENLNVTLGVPAVLLIVPFILVGLPACVAAFFIVGAAALRGASSSASVGPLLPVIVIAAPIFTVIYNGIRVGWTRILLLLADDKPASFSQLFQSMEWFWNFLIVNVLIGIITAIGTFLFVVPGVLFTVRVAFAPYLVVDRNMGPIEAMLESHRLVTGYAWQILIYYLLLGAANVIVGLVPFIGALLPIAVMGYFDLAMAMMYRMRAPVALPASTR